MPGEELTRWTVRLALVAYFSGCALLLNPALFRLTAKDAAPEKRPRLALACWTAACLLLWIHVGCAFQYFHDWSQSEAVAHTKRQTAAVVGIAFGAGVYVNYVVLAVWTADVLWWWRNPNAYASRSHWITMSVHAFLAFILFNAAVVFEAGPVRWLSALGFCVLALLWIRPALWPVS